MIWIDVDTAVKLFANSDPMMASADGTTIDETIAYNESGMELIWHFVTTAGVTSSTVITPTTLDDHDWLHSDGGIYTIELPTSGGDVDNDTEGFGFFTGKADAVLPWRSPTYGFRKASMNNVMIDNGTLQDNLENMYDGTGYVGGTTKMATDMTFIHGSALSEGTSGYLAAAFVKLFNVATPLLVASDVMRGSDVVPRTAQQIRDAMKLDCVGNAPAAGSIDKHLDDIVGDTDELQGNQGAWATATGFSTHNAAAVKTAMEAAGSDLERLMIALVNKMIITEANGNTEQFDDADSTLGSIAAAFETDGTYTSRKKLVI